MVPTGYSVGNSNNMVTSTKVVEWAPMSSTDSIHDVVCV